MFIQNNQYLDGVMIQVFTDQPTLLFGQRGDFPWAA